MDNIKETLIKKMKDDISSNPDVAQNYLVLGKFYLSENLLDEALLVYEKMLEKFPENMEATSNIGSINFYKQNYEKAVEYFEKAVLIDGNVFLIYFNLANSYAELGNFDSALINYQKALNLENNNPDIYDHIKRFSENTLDKSIFIIVGHSYEFEVLKEWDKIENLLKYIKSINSFEVLTFKDAIKKIRE